MARSRQLSIVSEAVKHLKQLRQEQGLSHEALARRTGLSRPAISHIENGRRKPSLVVALKIAHALDIELSELMRKIEKSVPK